MKRFSTVAGITLLGAGLVMTPTHGRQRSAAGPSSPPATQQELVSRYCLACHNDRAKTGNLSLEKMDPDNAAADAEVWEKVARKLRAGLMPPSGAPRPERAALD